MGMTATRLNMTGTKVVALEMAIRADITYRKSRWPRTIEQQILPSRYILIAMEKRFWSKFQYK
jgi:hypothetical protein